MKRIGTFVLLSLMAAAMTGCAAKSKWPGGPPKMVTPETPAAVPDTTQEASVRFSGNVRRPVVRWAPGLTLMRAYLLAGYQGEANPVQIAVVRGRETPVIMPFAQLMRGQDMLLEAGDVIEIR